MKKPTVKYPAKVLEPIKNHLMDKQKKLKKRKQDLDKEDPFADETRVTENASTDTDAAEQFGHARVKAIKEETDKMLIRIRKTLTKIKLGSYGLCEDCGKMIDTDRLAVDPTVRHCVECKRKQAKDK